MSHYSLTVRGPIPNPKDAIGNTLNHATCHDLIPLATAQTALTHH